MLAGLGAVLVSLDWRLGLVMTLPVPLFCWAIYRHGEALNRVFLRVWRKWSRLTDVLSDTMPGIRVVRSEEHTSELQSQSNLVCRLLLEKKTKHQYKQTC